MKLRQESAFRRIQAAESSAQPPRNNKNVLHGPMMDNQASTTGTPCAANHARRRLRNELLRQGFRVVLARHPITTPARAMDRCRRGAISPLIFIRIDPCGAAPRRCDLPAAPLAWCASAGSRRWVPDAVMDALLQREDAGLRPAPGQPPAVSHGRTDQAGGWPAHRHGRYFHQQDGDKRVIVLLELLGKANKVTLSRDWIARAA